LGISTKTVHKLVRERKLAYVRVTRRDRRFTHEQVQALSGPKERVLDW
jgi:excisionase family DNA binding protein